MSTLGPSGGRAVASADGLPRLVAPLATILVRTGDAYGSGRFGASRDGGKRRHEGVDLVAAVGDTVIAPIAGRVIPFDPYGRDPAKAGRFSAVQIDSADGWRVRLLYLDTGAIAWGMRVVSGAFLGRVQDLSLIYPPRAVGRMTPHIHFDLRPFDPASGRVGAPVDPTPLLDRWRADVAATRPAGASAQP